MKTSDQKILEVLLESGKYNEARAYIESALKAPEAESDKADAAIDYASLYLKITNKINRRYLESLRALEESLSKTNIAEGRIDDSYRLMKVRADLGIAG